MQVDNVLLVNKVKPLVASTFQELDAVVQANAASFPQPPPRPWGYTQISSILAEASKQGTFTGTPLREHAIVEGEIKQSKGKGLGWYVRLDRIVVDEKGQILLPWMTPIRAVSKGGASKDGKEKDTLVVAHLASEEVPSDVALEPGDAVRLLVLRVAQDNSNVSVSLDPLKIPRVQMDLEAPLQLGKFGGMQGVGAPCGKYNLAILTDRRTSSGETLPMMQSSFGIIGFESLALAQSVKEILQSPPVDLSALHHHQDEQFRALHMARGRSALLENDANGALRCFTEVLHTDKNNREAHKALAQVYRIMGNADLEREHLRKAQGVDPVASSPLQGQQQQHPPSQNSQLDAASAALAYQPNYSPPRAQPKSTVSGNRDACSNCTQQHALSDCPSFVCAFCGMWGHLEPACPREPPPSTWQAEDPLPTSMLHWEKLLFNPRDVDTWRPPAGAKRSVSPDEARKSGSSAALGSNAAGGASSVGAGGGPPARRSTMICYNCNEPGHHFRDCPQPSKVNRRPIVCFGCNEEGHHIHDCPTKQRSHLRKGDSHRSHGKDMEEEDDPVERERRAARREAERLEHEREKLAARRDSANTSTVNNNSSNNNNNNSASKKVVRCHNCDEIGHVRPDCPHPRRARPSQAGRGESPLRGRSPVRRQRSRSPPRTSRSPPKRRQLSPPDEYRSRQRRSPSPPRSRGVPAAPAARSNQVCANYFKGDCRLGTNCPDLHMEAETLLKVLGMRK